MPRPERALDAGAGPVQRFAADLRLLRRRAGKPGYRELARLTHFSVTTLATAAAGKRLPTLEVTLAYVEACGGDRAEWEERWRGLAAKPLPGPDDSDPPYRGLAAYRAEDAAMFFGRDRLVAELADRVAGSRFVAVFGPSGSGKSSILRAGLVPVLGDGRSAVLTPGTAPMNGLAAYAADPVDVLVVDQFEEVFTLCAAGEQEEFVAALLAYPRTVVIGVRADFYAACVGHPALADALRDHQTLVPPMTAAEVRDAVVRPAERAGLMVEGALVSTVVAEVTGRPGALPLASHALLEAWRRRRGNAVTLAGYEAAGGVRGALAQTAEEVHTSFGDAGRATLRAVLTRLIAPGDGVEDTRRRVERAELDLPGVDAVLDRLADARLVVLGDDTVEIAHEAIIEAWPRLRGWLSADRTGLRTHRRLTEATRAWVATGRDPGALYRGVRLAVAREWAGSGATLTPVERDFLDAGVALADREVAAAARHARDIRLLAVGLAVLLAVVSVASVVAVVQRRDAVDAQRTAVSRQLAVQALTLAESDPGTAMLLSVQAWRTAHTVEARSAVLSMSAHRAYRGELTGHRRAASEVVFAPDGRTMFSVGEDHTLRVWDVAARRQTAEKRDHDTWLRTLAITPDGRTLATGGDDGRVVLWDAATAAPIGALAAHTGPVGHVAFDGAGRRLATASDDGSVRVWDLGSDGRATSVTSIAARRAAAKAVAISPTTALLAVAYADGVVALLSAADGAPLATFTGHVDPKTGTGAAGVAFSPDGRYLATGGEHTTVILYEVASRAEVARYTHGNQWGNVISLRFSADSRTLATAGVGRAIMLWDVEHRVARGRLQGRGPNTYTLAFEPGGGRLVSAGEAGMITFWDSPAITWDGPVYDLATHQGVLATAGTGKTAVWSSGALARVVPDVSGEEVDSVAFAPDGRLVTSSEKGGVSFDGARLPAGEWVLDVAVSPDGRLAAGGGEGGTVFLWDLASLSASDLPATHRAAVNGVAFSPDGRTLATGGHDSAVILWDVARRQPLRTLAGHTGWVRAVAFSPDGRHLATSDTDHTVIVWDLASGGRIATLTDHEDAVNTGVAFSPDGRTLAYTSADNTVALWSVDRRAVVARLAGHAQRVRAVAFHPDGLLTAGEDRTVIPWSLDPDRLATDLCEHVARDLTREQWRTFLPDVAYRRTCA